jgi:hypothetical protein
VADGRSRQLAASAAAYHRTARRRGGEATVPCQITRVGSHGGRSFDDLIGAEQDHRWQDDTEGFRGLLVDDEADPGRLLNGQVAGPGALENPVDVPRTLPEHGVDISAVLQEAPTLGKAGDLQMAGSRCRAARPITRSV